MFILKAILIINVLGVLPTIDCAIKFKQKDSEITKFMKFLKVIPDVIDEGPKDFLNVTYVNGVSADKGVELTPAQVAKEPKVTWKAEKGAFYTLLMTDPDVSSKSEPLLREFEHWLVGNIPGNDFSKGQVLTAYIGATPPPTTKLHRYVLLLFKHKEKIAYDETLVSKVVSESRALFSTKKFMEKYKLGAPIAGNFFQAQSSVLPSVPILSD